MKSLEGRRSVLGDTEAALLEWSEVQGNEWGLQLELIRQQHHVLQLLKTPV